MFRLHFAKILAVFLAIVVLPEYYVFFQSACYVLQAIFCQNSGCFANYVLLEYYVLYYVLLTTLRQNSSFVLPEY